MCGHFWPMRCLDISRARPRYRTFRMLLLWRSILEDALRSCKAARLPSHIASQELPSLIWTLGWCKLIDEAAGHAVRFGIVARGSKMATLNRKSIVLQSESGPATRAWYVLGFGSYWKRRLVAQR